MQTVLCLDCGVARTNPLPTQEELASFYEAAYREAYKGVVTPRKRHVLRAARLACTRLAVLLPHLQSGSRLLDLGAGGGEFVALARAAGLAAEGIEPHAGYAGHAMQVLGLPVRQGVWQTAAISPGSFHAVTLFHVLEHLPDPVACLRAAYEWLKPEGLLLVEVPNLVAPLGTRSRRFHRAHLVHFTQLTLAHTARLAGFRILWAKAPGDGGNAIVLAQRPSDPVLSQNDCSIFALQSAASSHPPCEAAHQIQIFEAAPAISLASMPAHFRRLLRRWGSLLEEQSTIRRYPDASAILKAFIPFAPLAPTATECHSKQQDQ